MAQNIPSSLGKSAHVRAHPELGLLQKLSIDGQAPDPLPLGVPPPAPPAPLVDVVTLVDVLALLDFPTPFDVLVVHAGAAKTQIATSATPNEETSRIE